MKHIRQINSVGTDSYTVVITEGWGGDGQPPLEQHPSVIEKPTVFEVADCELPEYIQFVIYQQ